jgi:hypothetical protein
MHRRTASGAVKAPIRSGPRYRASAWGTPTAPCHSGFSSRSRSRCPLALDEVYELRAGDVFPRVPSSAEEDAGEVRGARLAGRPSRGALDTPPAIAPGRARTPRTPSNRASRFTSCSTRSCSSTLGPKGHPHGRKAPSFRRPTDNVVRASERGNVFVFFRNVVTLVLSGVG